MKTFSTSERPHGSLLKVAIAALKEIRPQVEKAIKCETGLRHPTQATPIGETKQMLAVDQTAEDKCIEILTDHFGNEKIRVLGEETLWPEQFKSLDLNKQHLEGYGESTRMVEGPETRIVAIIDMIDGSDLVERNFGNWCSAMIFSKPGPHPKILFSLVHQADGRIYGADEEGTFLLRPTAKAVEDLGVLNGPEIRKLRREDHERTRREETRQIAICFYGQQYKNFATLPCSFQSWIKDSPARQRIRIYNLAGNPMMARLANGEGVHAVFEHHGQFPHDAAPGAYIGLRAGGHLVDLAGNPITAESLAARLMRPSGEGLQYVLASTEDLSLQLADVLSQNSTLYYNRSDCKSA
jgi:fructose-1,6-bisphosphatase/inositol monophosphatase family enzyme